MPRSMNVHLSRQDIKWRGADTLVSPAEDVLHSLCMPGVSKPSCALSPLCAFPFTDFHPVLLRVCV